MMNWFSPSISDRFRYVRVLWPSMEEAEELTNITGGSMKENYLTALKVDGSLDYIDGLDMPRDLVRVYYEATDQDTHETERVALATFFVSTPSSTQSNITDRGSAECYSVLVIAENAATPTTYTVEAGENPVDVAAGIFEALGLLVISEPSTRVLNRSMTWDAGTSWLAIANDLLETADFCTALPDGYGSVVLKKYVNPADMAPVVTFKDDENCIFSQDFSREFDTFSIPNQVVTSYSTDEEAFTATAQNDDPASPYSTVTRGRVISSFESVSELAVPEDATSQEIQDALQAKADALLASKTSAVKSYEFSHVYYPYQVQDCIGVEYEGAGISIRMGVISRSIDFKHGAICKPRVREFVR